MTEPRIVLVTGGSRGIGLACARRFQALGDHVAVTCHSSPPPDGLFGVKCDVTDTDQVEAAFEAVEQQFGGPVEVLVSNAGVTRDGLLLRMSEDDFASVLDANLTASYRVTKRAAKGMLRLKRGRIILISSVVGLLGSAGQTNYSTAKAGVLGFTKALKKGLNDLQAATMWLMQNAMQKPDNAGAAATDYLHLLLGQERLETTITNLGMSSHTAPCPFLGQFLLMSHGRGAAAGYLAEPLRYGGDATAATLAYRDAAESTLSRGWRARDRRPDMEVQMLYSELFNAHASAADYARLMGLIAENQLGTWDHSVLIRRYLEWPTAFPANQSLAWLGYKGGSLPGVLTASYYAQPWDRARPVVVALFFHDLPLQTYREWRRSLPNDELARWLLYDAGAIDTLRLILFGE